MRRAERQKLAAQKAKAIMHPDIYTVISFAIASKTAISFVYTNRYGVRKGYIDERPHSFFETPRDEDWPGSVLLWSYHSTHEGREQYRVERISGAQRLISLMDAIIDPSTNADFWDGVSQFPESVFVQLFSDIQKEPNPVGKNQIMLDWLRKYQSPMTITIAGPSTDREHEAYSVYLDGIPLYFDDLNDAVVISAREIIAGAQLPALLKSRIIGIQLVEEDKRGDPLVVAFNSDGFITIYGGREADAGILAHEAAHEFSFTKWDWGMPVEGSDYLAAINSGEPPVSEYSKRNTGEDFAEAVRMFVVDSNELQKLAPLRYKAIKRLMSEKDYGG